MLFRRFSAISLFCCLWALCHTTFAAVTGRVVNGSGSPVADAMVGYTDLDNRLIYVYSDRNGLFSIPSPQEWDLKNLPMYVPPTAVYPQDVSLGAGNAGCGPEVTISGAWLHIQGELQQSLTVETFRPDGKRIRTLHQGPVPDGLLMIGLTTSEAGETVGLCLMRIITPHVSRTVRLVSLGRNKFALSAGDSPNRIPHPERGLTRSTAAIDSVRVGRTGYRATTAPLESYNAHLGEIRIVVRDIEAEVSALMQGKSKSWKAWQCVQGSDGVNAASYGTVFFGVRNSYTWSRRASTVEQWQRAAVVSGSAGIPQIVGIDAVHGYISPVSGTILPHNIGLGCSGNPELVELAQRVCAIECRALGINWSFAPCIDVVRNERHGRTYEGWDEGPAGTVIYSRAAVRGLQGTDLASPYTVAATAKHFAGAGGTANGVHKDDCNTADWETLCRIHLPGFKAACEAGVATVMAAFNTWLGEEMHLSKVLMTDTLKNRWGWQGFIVGDYNEAKLHGVTACVNAGLDNPMVPLEPATTQYNGILAAADARVDDACRRILRVKMWMDLENNALPDSRLQSLILSPMHRSVARECVRRSLVLLKNDNRTLPLGTTQNIHVMGSFADDMFKQCGGWTLGWPSGDPIWDDQGARQDPPPGTTLLAAIREACTGNVTYSALTTGIPATADVIVVCVGEEPYAEGHGDRLASELQLDAVNKKMAARGVPSNHKALLAAAAASGKPVVAVMYTGRPLIVTAEIALCAAFVCAWLPGTEGGGMADVLFNRNGENFTARLSHTWPSRADQIPMNSDGLGDLTGNGGAALFGYGYGLSY